MHKVLLESAIFSLGISYQALPADAQTSGLQSLSRTASDTASTDQRKLIAQAGGYATGLLPTVRAAGATRGTLRNGLPPTRLDSVVHEAGGKAWHIYGDEGVYSIPPFMEFTKVHRIEAGITGRRRSGLNTGHGSWMPDAWGGDEFVDGQEWSNSGGTGSVTQYPGNAQNYVHPAPPPPAKPVVRELPPNTPILPNESPMTPTSEWKPADDDGFEDKYEERIDVFRPEVNPGFLPLDYSGPIYLSSKKGYGIYDDNSDQIIW